MIYKLEKKNYVSTLHIWLVCLFSLRKSSMWPKNNKIIYFSFKKWTKDFIYNHTLIDVLILYEKIKIYKNTFKLFFLLSGNGFGWKLITNKVVRTYILHKITKKETK